jgi:prepilin-type N-terminal cleavage/methylation domain-containing protein
MTCLHANLPVRPGPGPEHNGFSLIELLSVMAIVLILLALAVDASLGWGRRAGLRAGTAEVGAALDLARQWARTHGRPTTFAYGNTAGRECGYVVLRDAVHGAIGHSNHLATGVVFTNDGPDSIVFLPDGTCDGPPSSWPADRRTILLEREAGTGTALTATITVFRLTGYVHVRD